MSRQDKNRTIGLVFLLGFAVHVILSLYLTFVPGATLGKSRVARFYAHFIHLGPFFTESRISSYMHFVVAFKHNGNWTEVDLTEAEVNRYRNNLFSLGSLTRRDFLSHNAVAFQSAGLRRQSEPFRKLHAFIKNEYIQGSPPDSVRWTLKQFSTTGGNGAPEVLYTYRYRWEDAAFK